LGLAIAKKIIELMGGELKITSDSGIGSEFSFTVLVKKNKNQSLKQVSFEPIDREDWSDMAKEFPLRILLAEDNDLNLQLMSLILDQLGYDLVIARNGQEAVEKVKEQVFDLVLMDVQMPVMNGLEAAKIIKKELNSAAPKIIGLSANVFDEDRKRALESGMDDYLTKPLRMDALAKKLKYFSLNLKSKSW
jgi:CheY-like chemotaxis protein